MDIKQIFKNAEQYLDKEFLLRGWVRNIRVSKNFGFIELNDGSFFKPIQIVFDKGLVNFISISKLNIGSSVSVTGVLTESSGAGQDFEINADKIDIEGFSNPNYPLQKKNHSLEYLRTIAHMRVRSNTFSAVFRVRSVVSYAIHKFFNDRNFVYLHSPIITSSDTEGAGEMFRVTTLEPLQSNRSFEEDFFGKMVALTVSGQLSAETFAMAFKSVYTFGPTFRAENSNTTRHAAEFWMIEPEVAFANLKDNMDLSEAMIKYIINYVMQEAKEEMEFFNKFVDSNIFTRLSNITDSVFQRIDYTDAIDILKESKHNFKYQVTWGMDLQTEHERYLTDKVYNKPVFVMNYPKHIKAFYMRLNDDSKTVAAMDLLVPGIGEIIGGSQREERLSVLEKRMQECGLNKEDYEWYLDTRRYGSVIHSGYGLGLERFIMYITGIANIRDVIAYPRTAGNCLY